MTGEKTVPMTPAGYKKLHDELKQMKAVERPKNIRDIEVARAHGDLSENAEYSAAKERQSFIAGKIAELEGNIAHAQVIDPATMDHDKVVFGALVRLLDTETEEELEYQIVGEFESNIKERKISITSPIAKSLIGKAKGDVVIVTTPRGRRELEILEIRYE